MEEHVTKIVKNKIDDYDDSKVAIFEGLSHILKRPSMYLGSLDTPQHTLEEALMNSLDEVKEGVATEIHITLHKDYSISILDNGRGIPPHYSEKFKMPTVRALLTVPNTGKGLLGALSTSSSQNGIGMKATTATAKWLEVAVWRNGIEWNDRYELKNGKPGTPVTLLNKDGELPSRKAKKGSPEHGTLVHWLPNDKVFDSLVIRGKDIAPLCEFQTYLNPGLKITITNELKNRTDEFYNPGGLESLIKKMAETNDSKLLTPIYSFSSVFDTGERVKNADGENESVTISGTITYAWSDSLSHQSVLYTNNVPNPLGGTPVRGAFAGLAKLINQYAKDLGMAKETIEQRDILPGLILILDITHPNPKFDGQTKKEITSKDALKALNQMVVSSSQLLFDRNINPIKEIIKQSIARANARKKEEAAKINIKRSDVLKALSKKLEPSRKTGAGTGAELFIVEGDSAGGTVVDERDTDTQAVIPIRGKIINASKSTNAKVMANAEVVTILSAIGTGVGAEFNIEKRNYDKVIITTDQDPDGSHITCLLLTMILRYMPELLLQGHVYRVITPLFVNKFKGKATQPVYTYSNREQRAFLNTAKGKRVVEIKRNKGIGEISPEMVQETIINHNTRKLLRYQIKDEFKDDALSIVRDMMGSDTSARKALFFNPDLYDLVEVDDDL